MDNSTPFFYLDNGIIKVRILCPNGVKYDRTRWCHAGFIQDVWCNGIRFSEYERNRHGEQLTSEGGGLCFQFSPISPEEAVPGKLTLLPGVGAGIYESPNEAKDRLIIKEHLDIKVNHTKDSAVFETQTPEVCGFSYIEKREIKLSGNEIIENVTFTNNGKKEIHTQEYCHNFLSLAGEEISPNYILDFPAAVVPKDFQSNAMVYKDRLFTFLHHPDKACYFDNKTDIQQCDEYGWTMRTKTGSAYCYEKVSFTPSRVSVWSDYYTLCPEIFVAIDLNPGEVTSWQRTWGFSLGD
ncbi:MAG: hypothetical protein IJO61_03295 [Oscillospiraceae bacterium]|nr:hypothetical protein [Oscillospiraceae bacterium]